MGASDSPAASQVYTWEPSNAAIAARYGLNPADILRFDTNTSPVAPDWLPDALRGPFDPTLNEYPDSSYAELTDAAADYIGVAPNEIVVGAGADEVLDLVAKAFLPAGSRRWYPCPPTPCTACSLLSGRRVWSPYRDWGSLMNMHSTSTRSLGVWQTPPSSGCARRTIQPAPPRRSRSWKPCCRPPPTYRRRRWW